LFGCATQWGVARLPNKSQLFVSQSPEDGFILAGTLDYPYQPLGYVAVDSLMFGSCKPTLKSAYGSLEKVIADKLVQKVKNDMGADGLINVTWSVTPGILTYVQVRGLAVKRK
jgi:hypothetical protein